MTLLMLDSIVAGSFAGLKFDGLAGYVTGSWPDFSQECLDYPDYAKANRISSVTPSAADDAEFLDCETGDATPEQVPAWLDRQLARGVWRPGVYANLSTWDSGLWNALDGHGASIRRWLADWTDTHGVPAGYDARQSFGPTYLGRDIDASDTLDDFFPASPQPPVHNPLHYDWFVEGAFSTKWGQLHERLTVEQYDGARKHPVTYAAYLKYSLEPKLRWLADRVAYEALMSPIGGKPSWGVYHRGWRYQTLLHRSKGRRFV